MTRTQALAMCIKRSSGINLPLMALAVFLAFVVVSCFSNGDVPPETIDIGDLLRRSGEATSQLNTFHFTLQHNEGGNTPFDETLAITEAEGDVEKPDKISVDFSAVFSANFAMRSSVIAIGDDSYMINPLSGNWEKSAAAVNPLAFFDPQKGIGAMITDLRDPKLTSNTEDEYIIEGDLDAQALRPLLGDATREGVVRAEITLDKGALFLKRAVIEGRVTDYEPDGVTRTLTLSRFNEPLSISAPNIP